MVVMIVKKWHLLDTNTVESLFHVLVHNKRGEGLELKKSKGPFTQHVLCGLQSAPPLSVQ